MILSDVTWWAAKWELTPFDYDDIVINLDNLVRSMHIDPRILGDR